MAKISTRSILEILQNKSEQILIPIYQRNYDWKEENVIKLLDDLLDFKSQYERDTDSVYFLGNMVYKPIGSLEDDITKLTLVDGQQRITTVLLILLVLQENDQRLDFSNYLKVYDNGEHKLKIQKLNNAKALNKILNNIELSKEEKNLGYYKNYQTIKKWIASKALKSSVMRNLLEQTALSWVKLSKLENENRVFETINSTGKPLTSSDLIKNYIFFYAINFSNQEEKKLSDLYLNIIEKQFENSKQSDNFFRYFVSVMGGYEIPRMESRDIYKLFTRYIGDQNINLSKFSDTWRLLLEILKSAKIFSKSNELISVVTSPRDSRFLFFQKVFALNKNTYYGIYYSIMNHWTDLSTESMNLEFKENAPSEYEINQVIARMAIYRSIAAKKDKNITKSTMRFFNEYKNNAIKTGKTPTLKEFIEFMEKRESTEQRVPSNNELLENIVNLDAYKISIKRTKNILLAAELGSNSSTAFNQFDIKWQIEHIMPQNWQEHWLKDMGTEKIAGYTKTIHTLPNLTLVTSNLNPKISNKKFAYKKQKIIEDSRLVIDKIMNDHEEYNDTFLKGRANIIYDNILNLFQFEDWLIPALKCTSEKIKKEGCPSII